MMKINLSGDKDDNNDDQNEENVADSENPTVSDAVTALTSVIEDEPDEETLNAGEGKSKLPKMSTPLLAGLLVILVVAVGFLQRDFILGLFTREAPVIETVAPPPPPPPPPEPEVVESEPDPAFIALNSISESITPRLWLTSTVIKYDGSYELKGMAFNHKSITDMAALLANMGTISKKSIPGKMKSAETVYRFSIDGVIRDITVPEILDNIPVDQLAAAANTIKGSEKDLGIKFSRLPQSGHSYTDKDMPFSLEGSYEGLKQVIGVLCPENGNNRVFRITIAPSSPGRSFDKIQASFSIKTISSI